MREARSSAALIYFGNEISSVVGSRANAILNTGRTKSSLYDEVWAIKRLTSFSAPLSVGKLSLYMVGPHVDRLLLSWAPYV